MQADVDPRIRSRCNARRSIDWLPMSLDGMCSRARCRELPCFVQPPVVACGPGPTSLTTPRALRETKGSAATTPTLVNQKMAKIGRMQSWI